MRRYIRDFLQLESASGMILLLSAVLAMVVANSAYADWHQAFVGRMLFILNDGLMTLFFLIIGIELKHSFIEGHLRERSQAILPAIGAIGGMAVPAFIYLAFNWGDVHAMRAWATPVATDIAFAVGILSLFGKRVPQELKIFLLALAIFDDLGAILIIAIFYSHGIDLWMLGWAALFLGGLYALNRLDSQTGWMYALLGVLLWGSVLLSGVHPTLAGVLFAFMLPMKAREGGHSLLARYEKVLHPWVAFLIMPLFAFVNIGFPLSDMKHMVSDPVVLGVALGLLFGKVLGVFGSSWWWVKAGLGKLPPRVDWPMLLGVAVLCGVGFTMSLFLGTLSFEHDVLAIIKVRLGVLLGSGSAAVLGGWLLWLALPSAREH